MHKTGQALRAAFRHTIPVLTGYLFLGCAFGILLDAKGYGPLWALGMSALIFAGSMQFVAVGLLTADFHPLQAMLVTLMVNARHIFYGLAMLTRLRNFGRGKAYMIFSLTDETFSLLTSAEPPPGVERRHFQLAIAALDHGYWVGGSVLGSLIGGAIQLDVTGIDFVMTALFTVIFLEQWLTKQGRLPAVLGVGIAVLCRLLFGPDVFLIPTMLLLTLALLALRRPLDKGVPTP